MAAADWDAQCDADEVAAGQLERHGFVHCCTREQIVEIASWWLKDDAPLVVLEIDPDLLAAHVVRFERPEGETREYPHVYGRLPRHAIVGWHRLARSTDGVFSLPPELAAPSPMFSVDGRLGGRPVRAVWQGGELVGGDPAFLAEVRDRVATEKPVTQFLDVNAPPSLATAYDAYSVLVDVLDEVSAYRGDGYADA